MKIYLFKIAIFAWISIVTTENSNKTRTKKELEILNNATNSVAEITNIQIDSSADYRKFKVDAEFKLKENERKIAAIKKKMKAEKKEIRIKYEKLLADLDAQNSKLKRKMRRVTAKDKWQSFKKGFNKDMDDLGKSISAFAEKDIQ